MKILVTGASGFVGTQLLPALVAAGHTVAAASRSPLAEPAVRWIRSPELGTDGDWLECLQDIHVVVHLAGRAHVTSEKGGLAVEKLYQRINADGTRSLARQAGQAGVKHVVFMSSLHAVAADSEAVITESAPLHPVSVYGRSKLAAEKAIQEELAGATCAWTILRPPLVYGPGNKANFGLLLKLVKTGIPLPLASVRNRRSFIYVENLIDLIVTCLGNPKVFGKTFLPSDGEDVSTPELIRAISRANQSVQCCLGAVSPSLGSVSSDSVPNKPSHKASCATRNSPRLFPFPQSLLKATGRLPGLGALRKLTSSLYVDSEPLRRDLSWTPPFTMEEGLKRTLSKRI